jgi:ribosomal protein L37AE/L43A
MFPRGIVRPLWRFACTAALLLFVAYWLVFVVYLAHVAHPHLVDVSRPRVPQASSSQHEYYRCTECRSASSRVDTVFTCHDCNVTRDTPDATPVPLSAQTLAAARWHVIHDAIADTALLHAFHCQWASSFWCHDAAVFAVGLVLDASLVSFHPVTLLSTLALLALLAYLARIAYTTGLDVTSMRRKIAEAQTDNTQAEQLSGLPRAPRQLVSSANEYHTQ